jgi:hypothetical protein
MSHKPACQRSAARSAGPDGCTAPVSTRAHLLAHLSTLDRQVITFTGQKIQKLTTPTPVQRRAFELLGAPVPLTLQ